MVKGSGWLGKRNWLEGVDKWSMVCAIHVGLGSMPSLQALTGEQGGEGLNPADGTQPGALEATLMTIRHQSTLYGILGHICGALINTCPFTVI